jgi:hypothetical protein
VPDVVPSAAPSPLPPTTPSAPRAMASSGSGEPARNGKPESGSGLRERDRERDREREREQREWVPRESAQQHHRERDRERGEREPPAGAAAVHHHPRDMPPGAATGGSNAPLNSAAQPQPQPPPQHHQSQSQSQSQPHPPLAESAGSGSLLSRFGVPYRSPPTASNSFRSDVGEQRSWPEDDWDGAARKRTLSGEQKSWSLFFFFFREV